MANVDLIRPRSPSMPTLFRPEPAVHLRVEAAETRLTKFEFVDAIMDLLGPEAAPQIVDALVKLLKVQLQETSEQRERRLRLEFEAAEQARLDAAISKLFEKWDNDCSGYLEFSEIVDVLKKWRDVDDAAADAEARQVFAAVNEDPNEGRINRPKFNEYVCFACCFLRISLACHAISPIRYVNHHSLTRRPVVSPILDTCWCRSCQRNRMETNPRA